MSNTKRGRDPITGNRTVLVGELNNIKGLGDYSRYRVEIDRGLIDRTSFHWRFAVYYEGIYAYNNYSLTLIR